MRSPISVLLAALIALPVTGQTAPKTLTLSDCIRLALGAQSAVTVARQESEVAGYGLTQARAGFLPQMHYGNGYTYNSPRRDSRDEFSFVALNGIREYTSQLTAVQELDTSGRVRAALARARADRDAAAVNLRLTERDLKRAVTAAFYQLLLGRRLVVVNQEALEEARSFEKRTRLLFENGEAAQADLVKASSQVAFLEQAQRAAELEAQIANHALASFWTREVADPLSVADVLEQPLPPPERPAPASEPFMRRLEFNLLEAQRRGFQADARRARAELFPQASFVFQYGLDSLRWSMRERGYAAFVNLNIPVFDWLKTRSQARQFQLRTRQVETTREITARNFSRDYQTAAARVKLIYDQLEFTQSQVKLSEENLRLSRVRYEGGEGTALDVVAAQNQLTQARINHYTAVANYLNARADLEVAAGS
jgi:outer membrane protein